MDVSSNYCAVPYQAGGKPPFILHDCWKPLTLELEVQISQREVRIRWPMKSSLQLVTKQLATSHFSSIAEEITSVQAKEFKCISSQKLILHKEKKMH